MIEMNLTGTNSGEIPLSDGDQRSLGVDVDHDEAQLGEVEHCVLLICAGETNEVIEDLALRPPAGNRPALPVVVDV